MPKFIIHPRVVSEKSPVETIEAAKVAVVDGFVIFLENDNAKLIIPADLVGKVELSSLA